MSRTYCYHCAGKLEEKDERSWYCPDCNQEFFDNTATCAEAIITNQAGEILAITRARDPYEGELDFPGGFVDLDETIEDALYRELNEEIGLEKADLSEPEYIGSYQMPYPWGKDVIHVVVAVFITQLQREVKLEARDEVTDARFMKFNAQEMNRLLAYRGSGNITDMIAKALES